MKNINHNWRTLAIIAIIAALAMMLLFIFKVDAVGPDCHHSSAATLSAVDTAMQAVRYGWPDAPQRMNTALRLARRDGVPGVTRRIMLARRYYRRGLDDLAKYHLWRAKHDATNHYNNQCAQ